MKYELAGFGPDVYQPCQSHRRRILKRIDHNMPYSFPHPKPYTHPLSIPCLIEEKLDGQRLMLWTGNAYARTENSSGIHRNKWDILPDQIKALAMDLPVDGELIWPGKPASDVVTGLTTKSRELRFVGFRIATQLLYPHDHRAVLEENGFQTPRLFSNDYIIVKTSDLKRQAIALDIEGWVLKARRTMPMWVKYKLETTYDLRVVALNCSRAGKYFLNGWIKSLVCADRNNLQVANVSGMSDEERSEISPEDIGRIVEVKANLFVSRGRLRHPRFVRWRDDKDTADII